MSVFGRKRNVRCCGKSDVAANLTFRHHAAMSRISMTWALALAAILTGCNQSSPTYSAACATPLPNWKTEKDGASHLLPIMPVFLGSGLID